MPGNNIVSDNILVVVNGKVGAITVDLQKYNLVVRDDVFIALEWVAGKRNSGIVFSAGFANKSTYYRKASQGRWRKKAMGVGLNVSVKY